MCSDHGSSISRELSVFHLTTLDDGRCNKQRRDSRWHALKNKSAPVLCVFVLGLSAVDIPISVLDVMY